MTDRPILFSAPMVRALLDGRKTQTRRIVKDAPTEPGWICYQATDGEHDWIGPNGYPSMPINVRFAKGDRLWVRETLRKQDDGCWTYDADGATVDLPAGHPRIPDMIAWAHHKESEVCVSIHMPRWASRLTLTVTDVRVQRLQEISPEDARDEGVDRRSRSVVRQMWLFGATQEEREAIYLRACVWEYEQLWDTINGAGSWDANPWIVAVSFTVERRNIDA